MFPCTNNATEYETLLHGLRMAKEMKLNWVRCFGDSDLVAQQVSGTWILRIRLWRLIDERLMPLQVTSRVTKLSILTKGRMRRLTI